MRAKSLKTYKTYLDYCYLAEVMRMPNQDQDKKTLTKDRLIGMQVIDSQGNNAGTVQDIAFTIGKVGQSLIVHTKNGEVKEFDWEDIQAAGDFVLLKPPKVQTQSNSAQFVTQQPQQSSAPVCPTCGNPLTYISQYQRWYCYKDKKYV
jgi:sporulation protein YlmC with PRC-barrel domain